MDTPIKQRRFMENSPTEIFKIMNLNKSSSRFKTAFEISTISKTKTPHETKKLL